LGVASVEKWPENLPEEVCSRTFTNSAVIGKCAHYRQPITEAGSRDRNHVKSSPPSARICVHKRKGMNLFRGWIGEKKAAFYLWLSLPGKLHHKFNNIILPSRNGTTQIDHLVISVFGIFIVETKNKKGWIFGAEKGPTWTQSIYRKKYLFQNPLGQAFRQKKILSEFLNLEESNIHTVIYFVGDCKFKTSLPDNVINSGVGRFIKRFRNQILSTEDVNQVIKAVEKHLAESSLSKRDHIKSLQKRHSSHTTCPRCGSNLIERVANRGSNAGTKFLGCENYPKCRFTKNAQQSGQHH
jgi:restriction system protein